MARVLLSVLAIVVALACRRLGRHQADLCLRHPDGGSKPLVRDSIRNKALIASGAFG